MSCESTPSSALPREYGPYPVSYSAVQDFALPDPLRRDDGSIVGSAAEWMTRQRERILALLKRYEYGEVLPRPDRMEFRPLSLRRDALGGLAARKEVRILCSMRNGKSISFDLLLYVPNRRSAPAPGFLGLNFKGNHAASDEKDVAPTGRRSADELFFPDARGVQAYRWNFAEVVRRGYASATLCYHDIHPDRPAGTCDSVFRLFFEPEEYAGIGEMYSIIGAWAWGLSRALDYLESDPDVDASRIAVHGHSRLGKTALWAGAIDPRFRMIVANCSGCGGAALHKRKSGENFSQHFRCHLERYHLPCWFVDEAEKFMWREEDYPIDQHELLAMAAPRPLAVGAASGDAGDPQSEFLACRAAAPVYRLFGAEGLPETMPPSGAGTPGEINYHWRDGKHDMLPEDWQQYLRMADRFLRRTP